MSRTTNFITPGRMTSAVRGGRSRDVHVPRVVRSGARDGVVAARRRTEGNARVGARADWRVGVPDPVRQAGDGARRGTARRRERVRFAKHASIVGCGRRVSRAVPRRSRVFRFSEREGAAERRASRDSRPRDRRGGARVSARARARGVRRRAAGVHVLAVAAAAAIHQPRPEPRVAPRRRVRVRRRRAGDVHVRAHLRARAAAARRERESRESRGRGRGDARRSDAFGERRVRRGRFRVFLPRQRARAAAPRSAAAARPSVRRLCWRTAGTPARRRACATASWCA